jgi:alpha-amylase/alpha-mannosidase (GH57 family)
MKSDGQRVNIGFIFKWHLPPYKNEQDQYILPWGRINTLRYLYDFLMYLKSHESTRVALAITPFNLIQLNDYIKADTIDAILALLEKNPAKMKDSEKHEALQTLFGLYEIDDILKLPGYAALLDKYTSVQKKFAKKKVATQFSPQEIRDLQVYFILSWFGREVQKDPELSPYFLRSGPFTESEKHFLLSVSRRLLREIRQIIMHHIPEHGAIVNTPFFHPIIPILNRDSEIFNRDGMAQIANFSSDAEWHIREANKYMRQRFKLKPWGMIAPESAFTSRTLGLFARYGIRFTVIEESHLPLDQFVFNDIRANKYLQREFKGAYNRNIQVFINDLEFQNKLALLFQSADSQMPLDDILRYCKAIANEQYNQGFAVGESLITVVFDLNRYYGLYGQKVNDDMFRLFTAITEDDGLQFALHNDVIATNKAATEIDRLVANTQHNDNFQMWIGNEEDNLAWEYLNETRSFLHREIETGGYDPEVIDKAKFQMYMAQSSDWWWIYGEDSIHKNEMEFDKLFRGHLVKVYQLLGYSPPKKLFQEIKWQKINMFQSIQPRGSIFPTIDGEYTSSGEWENAVSYDCYSKEAALNSADLYLRQIFVGYNKSELFFRIDFLRKPPILSEIVVNVYSHKVHKIICSPFRGVLMLASENEDIPELWDTEYLPATFAFKDIFEMCIPIKALNMPEGEMTKMQFSLKQYQREIERYPRLHLINLYLPPENLR